MINKKVKMFQRKMQRRIKGFQESRNQSENHLSKRRIVRFGTMVLLPTTTKRLVGLIKKILEIVEVYPGKRYQTMMLKKSAMIMNLN